MKITEIRVRNLLGLQHVKADLAGERCSVFCGPNGAGKSSVRDAIRYALLGSMPRVGLKKELPQLVREGAQDGEVFVYLDDDPEPYGVKVPEGQRVRGTLEAPGLDAVLDGPRFGDLPEADRRRLLFRAVGVRVRPENVMGMAAEEYGCDPALLDEVRGYLAGGFEAAQHEAQGRAREAKGRWCQATGERNYGAQKAEGWRAPRPEFDSQALAAALARREALEKEAGALAERRRQQAQAADLRAKAGQVQALRAQVEGREADLTQASEELRVLQEAANPAQGLITDFGCPHCGAVTRVQVQQGQITPAPQPQPVAMPEARTQLGEAQRRVAAAEQALREAQRALAEAEGAAQIVDSLGPAPEAGADEAAAEEIAALDQQIRAAQEAQQAAAEAEQIEQAAAEAHQAVGGWLRVAAAMAPDGIPGALLAQALAPITERLQAAASATGWPLVQVGADMAVTVGGRRYALLSESERWRANAQIAEAIAHVAGHRVLLLDRFDVLDLGNRARLFRWLHGLGGEYDTVLLLGTLKAPPKLPAGWGVHWLEGGRETAGPQQEAA